MEENVQPKPKKIRRWQKRGTGKAYNSLSAHASLIGYHSGKVLGYGVKTKSCAFCARGHPPADHDCRRNHVGSAKSMEPQLAVQLVTQNPALEKENAVIGTIVGDDDSCSVQAVRRESSETVEKWLDLNHVEKGFNNSLYSMKLPDGIRKHFCTSFAYCILQNKGNPEAMKAGLLNIIKHAYGEHEDCGEWCKYSQDPENYKHHGLPGGKPLTSLEIRASMTKLIQRYVENVEKIAPCASSQANESFNNLVATKNPKYKFNASSESLHFRVAACVGQKNIGKSYIVDVNKTVGLSPGNMTKRYRKLQDKYRLRRALHQKTKEYKSKRMVWKRKCSSKAIAEERSEGVTYSTGCELSGIADLVDDPAVMSSAVNTKEAIPVYFDLETTGLSKVTCEVLQIAAKYNDKEYSAYIVPSKLISVGASLVTGMTSHDGELFLGKEKVLTTPRRLALSGLISFLKELGPAVILVAHNGLSFDAPIIIRDMRRFKLLEEFLEVVGGFVDTLQVFRDKLAGRKASFKLTTLADEYSIDNPNAHNALGDVTVLQTLVEKMGLSNAYLHTYLKTVACVIRREEQLASKTLNKEGLKCLLPIVSQNMINKIADAGISLDKMKSAYSTGKSEAVNFLLAQDVNGKPRVTKQKNKLSDIVKALEKVLNVSENGDDK